MAKRFYDSMKFDDPWYRKLTPKQKCFWEFLLCKCSHVGIWKPDFELASFYIGDVVTENETVDFLDGRIEFLDNGDWFIPKFIKFQYDTLNKNVNTHRQIIEQLEKMAKSKNISSSVAELLGNCSSTVKDKDKDKDKDNNIINEQSINNKKEGFKEPTIEEIQTYCLERKNGWGSTEINNFIDFYASKGWMVGKTKMKNWKFALNRAEKWEEISNAGKKSSYDKDDIRQYIKSNVR